MKPITAFFALLMLATPPLQAQVTVLQLNDTYRIDAVDDGTAGGMGRAATLIERSLKRREAVLVLHGGDFIAPSLESSYFGGQQMIDAMNFLHAKAPLIVAPGNHEYDSRNPAMLANAIAASRFSWLAANLRLHTGTHGADRRIRADTIVQMGGVRIGIFGLTLLDDARSYVSVDTNYIALADQRIGALEQRGADVIVALTHLPVDVDIAMSRLRAKHPKFLWIVSGHEHNLYSLPLSDSTALITNSEANSRRVWSVRIPAPPVKTITASQVALDTTIAIDAEYRRQIELRYRAALDSIIPFFGQRIGTSAVSLDAREEVVRGAESNWGNYVTDVMRGAFPDIPADIGILNGGAIRIDDVFTGPIRWEHIARTFGFPTRVALVWLRGADVVSGILEHSVSAAPGDGRFLQVSGVRFAFDRRKPVGSRVSSVEVQRGAVWQAIDSAATYIVAVPDYSYGGGDDYTFRSRALMTVPPGPDLRLLVFDALSAKYATRTSIAPRVEGRIREIK